MELDRWFVIEELLEQFAPQFLFFAGPLGGAVNAVSSREGIATVAASWFTADRSLPSQAVDTIAGWVDIAVSNGSYRNHLNPHREISPQTLTLRKRMEAGFER
jgi:hypothetical protein